MEIGRLDLVKLKILQKCLLDKYRINIIFLEVDIHVVPEFKVEQYLHRLRLHTISELKG